MLKCLKVKGGGMKMKTNIKTDLTTIGQAFLKVIRAHPLYLLFVSFINLLLGLVLAFNTIALDNFFRVLGQYLSGEIIFTGILTSFLLLIISILANPVLNGLDTVFSTDYEKKVIGKLEKDFNEKCAMQETINFEQNDFLDYINKAQKGVENTVSLAMNIIAAIFVFTPYFIIISIYLYRLRPSLIIILFIFFIPAMLSKKYKSSLYAKFEDSIAPIGREAEHYLESIIDKDKFKETRLLGAYNFFLEKYKKRLKNLNDEIIKIQVKSIKIELLFKIPVLLGHILALILLVKYLMEGSIKVSNFGAILASIAEFMNMIEQFVFYVIGDSIEQIGSVSNYLKFMNIKESEGREFTCDKAPAIELKDVSFIYPESKQYAISNLSLKIKSGETIAIVGENGAGKTSLVNLISGIYRPSKGSVYYNNQDMAVVDSKSMMKNISCVFQDFQRYKITLYENIVISDTLSKPSNEYLNMILKKTGLNIDSKLFPNGLDTMLSRDFDGVELSGGQWQKIAISRGFYREHNIVILDEHTASIDPVEESNLFEKFIELAKGKTALIVTHRLALSKFADRIAVMDQGKLIQLGKHEELINIEGKYQELYKSQSKYYVES